MPAKLRFVQRSTYRFQTCTLCPFSLRLTQSSTLSRILNTYPGFSPIGPEASMRVRSLANIAALAQSIAFGVATPIEFGQSLAARGRVCDNAPSTVAGT